jgi:hypothetical protein
VDRGALRGDVVQPMHLGVPPPVIVGDASQVLLVLALDGERRARHGNVGVGALSDVFEASEARVLGRRARGSDFVAELLERLPAPRAELFAHRVPLRAA